jgi:hypothetical protein
LCICRRQYTASSRDNIVRRCASSWGVGRRSWQ